MHCHMVIPSLDRSGVGGAVSIRVSTGFCVLSGGLYLNRTRIRTTAEDTMSVLQVA